PDTDGFSICEVVRAALPQQAILMLTAKGSEEDILHGFRCGADDYVCKPFSLAQLMARVDALIRRSEKLADLQSQDHAEVEIDAPVQSFSIDALRICVESMSASYQDKSVTINRRDAELLALFAREQGRIVSRRLLLHDIWGFTQPDQVETRSVDMHIVKLRKKLAHILPQEITGIETIRGEGYRWPGISSGAVL
ncbi:MAG: response regulator transcription factor, partial [Planctomycetes bacterium]|nr:response regulator transcription factor [Planctomycetota bacterium]